MKKMKSYTTEEWEKICLRCGKCCLIKLQDEDSGAIYYTNVICRYYDDVNNCCSVYDQRCELVPECLKLNQENIQNIDWMPKTCAYRCLAEKKEQKKISTVKGRCISETLVDPENLEDYIVDWDDL